MQRARTIRVLWAMLSMIVILSMLAFTLGLGLG